MLAMWLKVFLLLEVRLKVLKREYQKHMVLQPVLLVLHQLLFKIKSEELVLVML